MSTTTGDEHSLLARRFRGYLPVVVDVECGGFNARTDALLEISAVIIKMDDEGFVRPSEVISHHIEPFEGANIESAALEFTGIDPYHPFRHAVPEKAALTEMFRVVRRAIRRNGCTRAILCGHNAFFDHAFVSAAAERSEIKRNPFHPFSCLDTVTLAALAYGQTVLQRACECAGIEFEDSEAHSAVYDAQKTAELFCMIVNRWQELGGWPLNRIDDHSH
ncbi:MAG: ribonuclease T [Pseudomonadales bacterium]